MGSTSTSSVVLSPLVTFPSPPTVSCLDAEHPTSPLTSSPTGTLQTPSVAELIAGTRSFQKTFSKILESVRLMKAHLEAFDSSALLTKSYDFETDLLLLVSQITEVADSCVDFETCEGDYEISRSNVRFTLRAFLQMVESRRLNCASICLAFTVDAMYTFMELSIQEVSRWKVQRDKSEPPSPLQDVKVSQDIFTPKKWGDPRNGLPDHVDQPSKPSQQKPSMLKRLRTVSHLSLRNPLPSFPDRSRRATLSPGVLRQMEESLRLSIDQMPRPLMHRVNGEDMKAADVKAVQGTTPASLPDRLQRALRRCKSVVKLEDGEVKDGQRQRKGSQSSARLRALSLFRRRDATPPVPPLPQM